MTGHARRFAVAVAYAALLGQLGGFVHLVAVRHATCASHGEVVHGTTTPQGVPVAQQPGIEAHERAEAPDEHCFVVALRRRETAGLSSDAGHPRAIVLPAVRSALPDVRPLAANRLVLFAPKTSPPVAHV